MQVFRLLYLYMFSKMFHKMARNSQGSTRKDFRAFSTKMNLHSDKYRGQWRVMGSRNMQCSLSHGCALLIKHRKQKERNPSYQRLLRVRYPEEGCPGYCVESRELHNQRPVAIFPQPPITSLPENQPKRNTGGRNKKRHNTYRHNT